MEIERGNSIVLMGDMSERVGSSEVAGVMGKWGVDGVKENDEYLVTYVQKWLFLV